jgi:hypothetical protein
VYLTKSFSHWVPQHVKADGNDPYGAALALIDTRDAAGKRWVKGFPQGHAPPNQMALVLTEVRSGTGTVVAHFRGKSTRIKGTVLEGPTP